YEADKIGAQIAGDPQALATALDKLHRGAGRIDNEAAERNPSTAHMFIVNPLHARSVDSLFSTHPNVKNRIARLLAMASGTPVAVGAAGAKAAGRRGPWG